MWVQLACAFRYGREDLDVIGVSFRKDIWMKRIQMYPFEGTRPANTTMQEALLKKAGDQGHPFTFEVNTHLCICLSIEKTIKDLLFICVYPILQQIPVRLPCSVSLQPAPEDAGKVQLQKCTHKCNHKQVTMSLICNMFTFTALRGWLWSQSIYCTWSKRHRWESWKEVCTASF